MEGTGARRGLQILLSLLGGVALAAGALSVVFGVSVIPEHGTVNPNVDSEMRFYAVWYAAAGLLVLSAVPKIERADNIIRGVAGAFFIAGCARFLSMLVVGRPHVLYLILTAVELVLPFVIVPWQSAVARRI